MASPSRRDCRTRRRDLLTVAGGVAAWLHATRGRASPRARRVGVLMQLAENDPLAQASVKAFVNAMAGMGWVEGESIQIDYRFAAGNPTLFKTYADELVGLRPDAILAITAQAVAALQRRTRTVPIVFLLVTDPLGEGFVQSIARPGGNITGFGPTDPPIMGKWLQLIKEAAPNVTRVAIIFNPSAAPYAPVFNRAIEAAAPSLGMTARLAPVRDDVEIGDAIATQAREPGGGLIALPDSFTATHRNVIIAAAIRHRLPLMGGPNSCRAGALMSYWFNPADLYTQGASYIDKILKGANPADLPVQYPTKYSLVINLKTAKVLGLAVPQSLLVQANEVIE